MWLWGKLLQAFRVKSEEIQIFTIRLKKFMVFLRLGLIEEKIFFSGSEIKLLAMFLKLCTIFKKVLVQNHAIHHVNGWIRTHGREIFAMSTRLDST